MKRWRIGLPGLLLSLLATWALVTQLDLDSLVLSLRTAQYGWLLPAFLLLLAGQMVRALRWRALLEGGLPLARAFHILNISYMANAFLPFRFGELARIWLVRPGLSSMRTAGSILLERLLDTLAVLVMLAAALSVLHEAGDDYRQAARLMLPLLLALALALFSLARRRTLARRLLDWTLRLPLPGAVRRLPLGQWLEALLDGLQPLTNPALLLRVLVWTLAGWTLSLLASYLMMLVFYEKADLAVAGLSIVAAALVIALPAVPGNIGTYQWAIMLALAAGGYGEPLDAPNVSLGLAIHAINLLMYTLTGCLGLIREQVTPVGLVRSLQDFRLSKEGHGSRK
ncbi:MAG: lysylphosphatidylglycerol synthase transmembrane domain-containing protein [Anaerolineaceae bacterium]|nr:lysylphosphatidylglycerol synthase transmembrane domain-containing protein [Anaerolineaceae bacterium]